MAALMPEGLGAPISHETEDKPRIRVRLHFGGTFAQDGPRQWRYVGGEVYNESFPMDSKYAEVSKRLNDKFGDTVSFKYLCPGDDIDPDNLVQVQGDDDLREMCDEYQNALQKPSTPVKTVRIKVFVFRAVIFEREVQELEEDNDLEELPDDDDVGEPLSSCDHEECGPNWSDWGEPDEHEEVTESSMPSAHLSSDMEVHTGAAVAIAAAAATAALQNISVSVNSFASSRTAAQTSPAPFTPSVGLQRSGLASAAVGGKSRRSPADPTHLAARGGIQADGFMGPDGGRPPAGADRSRSSAGQVQGGAVAMPGAPSGNASISGGSHSTTADEAVAGPEDAELAYASEAGADAEVEPAFAEAGGVDCVDEDCFVDLEKQQDYWRVGHDGDMRLLGDAMSVQQASAQRRLPQGDEWLRRGREGAQVQWRGPTQEDGWQQHHERVWDLEQQQERQQIVRQQEQQCLVDEQQERQNWIKDQKSMFESELGFYCDEELEDPYGDPYEEDGGEDATALYAAVDAGVRAAFRSSAASDGVVRILPRAADVAAYGDHFNDQYGAFAMGGDDGGGAAGRPTAGLLGRLPAAADLLPRHISAFGESSRDDSQAGAVGAAGDGNGGPFLPSRITIFGDGGGGDSLNGSSGGAGGRPAGGGLHRLALLSAGAAGNATGACPQPWPDPSVAGVPPADGMGKAGVAAPGGAFLGPAEGIVAGDSRQCITQEFGTQQQSLLLDGGGLHGSSGEDAGDRGEAGGGGGRVSPLDPLPLDPLLRTGLGGGAGGLLGMDALGPASMHNHPLKGVVKKRKSEVTILAKIGEGAFGEVSQAQVFPYGIVAIKWLKRERFAKYSESFQREAETLAKLNHPNIIRMYGLVMDAPEPPSSQGGSSGPSGGGGAAGLHGGSGGPGHGGSGGNGPGGAAAGGTSGCGTPTGLIGGIITEFVRNGSLGQYLRSLSGRRLSLRQRAMIALQAALGMAYLHEQSPAVVHFDLKPDNLLVDGEGDSMVIKVADFGLSKHKLSNYVSCRDLRGTLPYMAYELVSSTGNISEKVDVYSMGVVMWEMYTGEVPFAHLTAQEILTGLLHGNLHLAIPPACEPEWRSLVETCMDPNPANRPSFQELTVQLQEILRLERQASNASSVSAATAAAAVAAVLDSVATAPDSAGGAVAGGGVQVCGLGLGGAGGGGIGAAAAAAAAWRLPPGGPQVLVGGGMQQQQGLGPQGQQTRSPVAPTPMMPMPQRVGPGQLLGVLSPTSPPPAGPLQPPPAGQSSPHILPPHILPPPVGGKDAHHQQQQQPAYGAVPYGLLQQPLQQPTPPQPPAQQQQPLQRPLVIQPPPLPQQPPAQQPAVSPQCPGQAVALAPIQVVPPAPGPQHQPQPNGALQGHPPKVPIAYGFQHLAPILGIPGPVPPGNAPSPHLLLQLRPPALFSPAPPAMPPQPQQPHGQHRNGLYGLGGGAGAAGLAPLVSWGDRGM